MSPRVNGRLLGVVVCLLVCPLAAAKKYTLITEPVADGCLFVNGEFVGVSPVEVDLRSRKTKRLSSPPRRMARSATGRAESTPSRKAR